MGWGWGERGNTCIARGKRNLGAPYVKLGPETKDEWNWGFVFEGPRVGRREL